MRTARTDSRLLVCHYLDGSVAYFTGGTIRSFPPREHVEPEHPIEYAKRAHHEHHVGIFELCPVESCAAVREGRPVDWSKPERRDFYSRRVY